MSGISSYWFIGESSLTLYICGKWTCTACIQRYTHPYGMIPCIHVSHCMVQTILNEGFYSIQHILIRKSVKTSNTQRLMYSYLCPSFYLAAPPVITSLKSAMLKHEIIFLCETSNKHPVEYAWLKDGKPLFSRADTLKVPLRNNTITGLYECHVSNIAGRATKSLAVAPLGKTGQLFLMRS